MKLYHIELMLLFVVLAIGAALSLCAGYVLSLVGVHNTTYTSVFEIIILLVFGYMAIRFLSDAIVQFGKTKKRLDEGSIAKLVSLLGYLIMLLFLMSFLEINITGVLVGAGFLGIVIGLASQSTLGNLFAGMVMMAAKPFASGDRITFSTWQYGILPPSYAHSSMLPGYSGVIKEIGLMYTEIKTDEGMMIYVPNGILNQAVIINYTVSDIIDVTFRAELPIGSSFEAFQGKVYASIKRNTSLAKLLKGHLEMMITDAGTANYGVKVRAAVAVEHERFVQKELGTIVMKAIARQRK